MRVSTVLHFVLFHFYHTTDSAVYSPEDGDLWLLAKDSFQVTDYAYVEMVEHLLKTHLMMEPFCVCILRYLSKLHPLHQLMKYHCRYEMRKSDSFHFVFLVSLACCSKFK